MELGTNTMSVYIANFGKGNWAWPKCHLKPALAVMDDERVHLFWKAGDRAGYIEKASQVLAIGFRATCNQARGFQMVQPEHDPDGDGWRPVDTSGETGDLVDPVHSVSTGGRINRRSQPTSGHSANLRLPQAL